MAQNIMDLNVETGSCLINVNDEHKKKIGEFFFIPTDFSIIKRYENVAEFFNGIKFPEDLKDDEYTAFIEKLNSEICEQFDLLLGAGAAKGLFGKCSPTTVISNGDFFFERIFVDIEKLVEKTFNTRIDKKMKRIEKATSKYHK